MAYQTQLSSELLAAVLQEQQEAFLAKDLGVERKMLSVLQVAVESPQVVVMTGLRRASKSTLLAQIARRYLSKLLPRRPLAQSETSYYFVNFEDERLLIQQFN